MSSVPLREADTPASAFGLLERRVTVASVGVLLVLAAAAWVITVRGALDMSGMAMGLGQLEARMPNQVTAPIFLGMWLSMMVAMMFPTIGPVVLAHRMVVRQRGETWLSTGAFVLGYLAVWTAIGLVPLGALLAFRTLAVGAGSAPWLPLLAGGILVLAGVYQFTPWKGACLRACRSPLGFILTHDFRSGSRGAFRAGLIHGAYCLGCCWALMSVLVVVGLMNLVWMAALAAVFLAEKNWRHGRALTRVAGVAVAAIGLGVIIHPEFLATVSGGPTGHM